MKKYAFLAILFIGAQGWSLTLGEIKTQVRRNLRDTSSDTTLQRYSSSLLTDMANEAQRDIINQTWATESSTRITTVASQVYYNLPSDYLAAIKVSYRKGTAAAYELTENSRKGLYAENPNWESATGSPAQYYIRQATSTTAQQIAFIQIPTSSSTGTATIDYFNRPADMSSDSDLPFGNDLLFVGYHDAIVYYVCARLKAIEGKVDESAFYVQLYTNSVGLMKDRLGMKPNYSPSIKVGTPR